MTKTILILGGYGVFGGRLAQLLIADGRYDVIVAGRRLAEADDFCRLYGGRPFQIDTRDARLEAIIASLSPFLVIDAVGPFQAYDSEPYRIAKAALSAGAHYIDLSDDAQFTAGIIVLDSAAKAVGRTVLSGVSSVPALSSSAVTELKRGMDDVHLIETAILPGNRARRGHSVVRAILSQAGRPMNIWCGSKWVQEKGWSRRQSLNVEIEGVRPIRRRWASLIGAPDLTLFPAYFRARSVIFRAGLELKFMHGGLAALSRLVQWKLIRSLAPLAPILKWIADRLQPFGTDRGGMVVSVTGQNASGTITERRWSLIVEAGDGPSIPGIPATIIAGKLLADELAPGARPCLSAFSLEEAKQALSVLSVSTGRSTTARLALFEIAIGTSAFRSLPRPIRDLHTLADRRHWRGLAEINRGKGILSGMAAMLAGFPPTGKDVPVRVRMQRRGGKEVWVRTFGQRRFRSQLSLRRDIKPGITERFGAMAFDIDLRASKSGLYYPVAAGRIFGVPLPRFILPRSETREFVDDKGRACFDVSISLPIAGSVVRYRGFLVPDDARPA